MPAVALGAHPTSTAILAALGRATFNWDIASDTLHWLDGTEAIFASLSLPATTTGAAFANLIEPVRSVRLDAVLKSAERDHGGGVAYRIEYGLRADPSTNMLWIEEGGRWFAGADGAPARVHGVMRIDNERHARDQQLLELSRHDPLTGEFNRSHLVTLLATTFDDTARFRTQAAFMVIAIDYLARVNDAFGFDVADQVICEVSARIRARLRGGDVMGRFSGNKFGLILKNCGVDDMQVAAERFLAGVREPVVPTKSGPVAVTASIGAVSIPRHARSVDDAMNRAQEALEAAKSRRQGSYSMWQPNVEREAQRRLNIRVTDEIVTALNQRRIGLGFEPVVEARAQDNVVFYESLVRMRQDNGEFLLGPDIVPIAEKLGLIRLVDHRVLELVIAELVEAPGVQLSLNISPGTTMDPDWWAIMESLLKAHPDVAARLI
ncbi:MAG: diguanylate cyclase, partial [Rhizobiales bacterium]|nr:diguanylate cyclase [Hyphomicrobiales bacterium]